MHCDIVDILVCPDCRGEGLVFSVFIAAGPDVVDGVLTCPACRCWYRIESGVLDLLPASLRRTDLSGKFAGKYSLAPVVACGAAVPSKRQQIDFFAKDAAHYEQDVTQSPYFKALDDLVFAPWLADKVSAGCRFLEVGVGTGRQCVRVAENGVHVVGIDISEEMLLVARSIAGERGVLEFVDLIVADAEALPFRSGCFDAMAVVGTLHHVPGPQVVIREIGRVLRNGAPVFSYDPHKSPVRFMFDALMRWWKLYDEEAAEDPLLGCAELAAWMQSAGVTGLARVSTYIPPHAFYLFGDCFNIWLLRSTDALFNVIPGIRRWGGMVVFTGVRT